MTELKEGTVVRRVKTAESDYVVEISKAGIRVKAPGGRWRGSPVSFGAVESLMAKQLANDARAERPERKRKVSRSFV